LMDTQEVLYNFIRKIFQSRVYLSYPYHKIRQMRYIDYCDIDDDPELLPIISSHQENLIKFHVYFTDYQFFYINEEIDLEFCYKSIILHRRRPFQGIYFWSHRDNRNKSNLLPDKIINTLISHQNSILKYTVISHQNSILKYTVISHQNSILKYTVITEIIAPYLLFDCNMIPIYYPQIKIMEIWKVQNIEQLKQTRLKRLYINGPIDYMNDLIKNLPDTIEFLAIQGIYMSSDQIDKFKHLKYLRINPLSLNMAQRRYYKSIVNHNPDVFFTPVINQKKYTPFIIGVLVLVIVSMFKWYI
jgi:hypothetical protein